MPGKNSKAGKKSNKNKSISDLKSRTSESDNQVKELILNDDKEKSDNESVDSNSSEEEDSKIATEKEEMVKEKQGDDPPQLFPVRRRSCHNLSEAGKEAFQRTAPETKVIMKESSSATVTKKVTKYRDLSPGKKLNVTTTSSSKELQRKYTPFLMSNKNFGYGLVFVIISVLFFIVINCSGVGNKIEEPTINIESMKQNFPKQDSLLWRAIASGINTTLRFEHPTSYIFLHESGSEVTMKELLNNLSQYTVCQLSKCNCSAIQLDSEKIANLDYLGQNDYGTLIAKFKEDLETTGLMIVENIDKFPEKYAQAFHSFCDEVSPLVKKSAFFFTVKVNSFNNSPIYDVRTVEKMLRQKWAGLSDDVFAPLFTRMSGMLLRVHPEKLKNSI